MNKPASMPKLSKASLSSLKLPKGFSYMHIILIVLCIVFAGLTIYFAVSYFQATGNKNDVEKQVTQKQQQIDAMGGPQNISALLAQLEDALKNLEDESPFPDTVNNVDVAYAILQASREASITCYDYDPGSPSVMAINVNEYIENRYSISSSGPADSGGEKLVRITHFFEELEAAYDTYMISGVSLSDTEGDGLWTVSFTYSVLSLRQAQ